MEIQSHGGVLVIKGLNTAVTTTMHSSKRLK